MNATRRRFIQTSAMVGAGVMLAGRRADRSSRGRPDQEPPQVRRSASAAGLQLRPGAVAGHTEQDHLQPDRRTGGLLPHHDGPVPVAVPLRPARTTSVWGYADITDSRLPKFSYLGASIVAIAGTPVRIDFVNELPEPAHRCPSTQPFPGAETGQLVNRAAVHLHGGFVPWPSDGGPFHWFAPDGTHGPSLVDWLPDATGPADARLLLPERAERPPAVVPRPRGRHHPPQRLCRPRRRATCSWTASRSRCSARTGRCCRTSSRASRWSSRRSPSRSVADAYGGQGSLDYSTIQDPADIAPGGGPPAADNLLRARVLRRHADRQRQGLPAVDARRRASTASAC